MNPRILLGTFAIFMLAANGLTASAQEAPVAKGGTVAGAVPPTTASVKPVGVSGDFVNLLDATFGRDRLEATIRDKNDLDRIAYYRYIYGDGSTTGDGTDGLYKDYRSRHRDYPDGDPRALHVFTFRGLVLRGHCGLDTGIRSDCSDGNIESGIIRFALPIHPGSYIEIRCRMPPAMYAWPAFWLNSGVQYPPVPPSRKASFSARHWPPEIDIFDQFGFNNTPPGHYLNNGTSTNNNDAAFGNPRDTYHAPDWGDKRYYQTKEDLVADYHVYGLDWGTDDKLKFYLDGRLIRERIYAWNSVDHVPAHLIASLAVGAKFNDLSHISDQGGVPHGWDWPIDYIRVWQHKPR